MSDNPVLMWAAFAMASSLVILVSLLLSGRKSRADARAALPRMGAVLMPKDDEERTRLRARLIHAGLYSRQAMVLFLGVKVALMVGPGLLGLGAGLVGLVPVAKGLIFGALLGVFGMIGPSFWLDRRKADRQVALRRALPDALDVLVICLDGGMSFPAALRRVSSELHTAHPLLADELNIAQREVQLGRTTGEALRQFGERADLDEVRSLASVILQADRFGASLVKALRVHAESLRVKRLQRAEELAQQAATKLLIPTALFIFPCIFVIILGPAVIQIMQMLSQRR